MTNTETLSAPRVLLTMAHVQAMFSASRDAVVDMVARGVLPQPFKLGTQPQSPLRWDSAEIDSALAKLPRVALKGSKPKTRRRK